MIPVSDTQCNKPPRQAIEGKKSLLDTTYLAVLLVISLVGYQAWQAINCGGLHGDENYFTMACRLAMEGKIPYRDFGYTQTPLLPYLYGPLMFFTGWDLFGIRAAAVIFTLAAALIVTIVLARKFGVVTAVAAVASLAFSEHGLYMLAVGKTYAAAGTLLAAAALPFFFPGWPWKRALLLTAITGAAAVAIRLPVLPAFIVLCAGLWWTRRKEIPLAWALAVPTLVLLVLLGPFVMMSPERAAFWMVGIHTGSTVKQILPVVLKNAWVMCPGIWSLAAVGLVYGLCNWRQNAPGLWVLMAGLAAAIANIAGGARYGEYLAPFQWLIVLGGSWLIAERVSQRWLGVSMFAAFIFLSIALGAERFAGPTAADFTRLSTALKQSTPPTATVLTSELIAVSGAERHPWPGTEMGSFATAGLMPTQRVKALGMTTLAELKTAVEQRQPDAVILSRTLAWNFGWRVPEMVRQPQEDLLMFLKATESNYHLVYMDNWNALYIRR